MGRSSPTRVLVRKFAADLLLSRRVPTQSALRDLIFEASGLKPSPHTVAHALSQFWDELLPKIGTLLLPSSDSGTSEEAPFSLESFTSVASDTSDSAETLEELTRLQYDNRELRINLMRQGERILVLEREVAEKSQLLNSAVATAGDALARTKSAERRAADAEADAATARESLARGISQLRQELMAEAERVRVEFEAERETLKANQAALEGTRRHLMMETDKIRTNSEYQIKGIRAQLETAQFREQQYLVQKNAAVEEAGRLREQLEQLLEARARESETQDGDRAANAGPCGRTANGSSTRTDEAGQNSTGLRPWVSDDPDGFDAE